MVNVLYTKPINKYFKKTNLNVKPMFAETQMHHYNRI
jgi:hypothetical protein